LALKSGCSVDTMGFTPLEGLAMATRSGSMDPRLLLWLLEQTVVGVQQIADTVRTSHGCLDWRRPRDMRAAIEAAANGDERARLALDVYVHRLRAGVAAMNGLNAGGVGENEPTIRAAATDGPGFLGVPIDDDRNQTATGDLGLTAHGSRVRTLVITVREDLAIVRRVPGLMSSEHGEAEPAPASSLHAVAWEAGPKRSRLAGRTNRRVPPGR
jgi:acetate kinase